MSTPRIAVVGLGAAGLGAALATAERGATTVGFEQYDLDHQPASSGGRGKIIRFGYDDPFYADLMRSTYPRWQHLAAATGRNLMALNGGLHMGSQADIDVVRQGIVDAGQPVEAPDPSQFGVRVGDGEPAIFEPTAGVMWTSQVRGALADAARSAGAELRVGAEVERIDADHERVVIRTREGSEVFDRAIVAGGPWAFRLASDLAGRFQISRRFQVVFGTDKPLGDGLPRPWIDHAPPGFYGMINVSEGTHLIGLHELDQEQPVHDPDDRDDEAIAAESVRLQLQYVASRFGVEPTVIDVRRCHYTSTASRDFVVDEIPGRPRTILLSACSGHGFKFSVTTGMMAAGVAFGEPAPERFRMPAL